MGRYKVTSALKLETWEDADETLRQIGEDQRDLAAIENLLNERIAAAKTEADAKARPIKEQIAMKENALRDFTARNRKDMIGKTKRLTFGSVGYRLVKRIKVPTAAAKLSAIIERLFERGMNECVIKPPARVDKNALAKYSADEIAQIGASLEVEDTFGYEVDQTKLEAK